MDKYEKQIEALRGRADWWQELVRQWCRAEGIFQYCTPSGKYEVATWCKKDCGCLTMDRGDRDKVAWTPGLTCEVRSDLGLPRFPEEITLLALEAMAEWQRRLDVEIRR